MDDPKRVRRKCQFEGKDSSKVKKSSKTNSSKGSLRSKIRTIRRLGLVANQSWWFLRSNAAHTSLRRGSYFESLSIPRQPQRL
ncbi:Concanavalin A-like lectin/glucanase, subgroup [Sesbania bispinosa]|nr:Concanavalin A-like lectin/glucanase, subgroup [Sesbania bispinosa]